MKDFDLLPTGAPDGIDLELDHLGAVDDLEARRRIREAAAGHLAELDEELRQARAAWDPPPLTLPQRLDAQTHPTSSVEPTRSRWPLLLAIAALLVLGLGVFSLPSGSEDGPELRPMGSLPVELVAEDGADPNALRAGDRLSLAWVPSTEAHAVVASLQDDGEVTTLWSTSADAPLPAGVRFALPGAIELDAYAGREWLVVLTSPRWLSDTEWRARLDNGTPGEPEAADGGWIQEVTRAR